MSSNIRYSIFEQRTNDISQTDFVPSQIVHDKVCKALTMHFTALLPAIFSFD